MRTLRYCIPKPTSTRPRNDPREAGTSGGLVIPGKGNDMEYGTPPRHHFRRAIERTAGDIHDPNWRMTSASAMRMLGEVIYAVQFPDGIIKIGWTRDLSQRIRSIGRPGEVKLIGFMRGTLQDELAIHRKLARHVAYGREYYHPRRQVVHKVNDMRRQFGLPRIHEPIE